MVWLMLAALEWTQWGYNPQNTFLSPGSGDFGGGTAVMWSVTSGYSFGGVPLVADLDGDGKAEAIALDGYNEALCVFKGEDGSSLWTIEVPDTERVSYEGGVAVGDLNGDGQLEAVFGTDVSLYCASSSGSLLWSLEVGVDEPIKLADLDGDGSDEVLVVSPSDTLYAVDGDGSVLWGYYPVRYPPAIGDVDGDGQVEVVTAEGKILSVSGSEEDSYFNYTLGLVAIEDLDGDGSAEIIGVNTLNPVVRCFERTANGWEVRWAWTDTIGQGPWGELLMLGDLNGDGVKDVVYGESLTNNDSDRVIALNGEDGSVLWVSLIGRGFFEYHGALADLDGDGKLEVLVPVYKDEVLVCLNGDDGSTLWREDLSGSTRYLSVGDLEGDGELEILLSVFGDLVALDAGAGLGQKEWASSARVTVRGGRGFLLLESPEPAEALIYSQDGRLVKTLRVRGRKLVSLRPGVYIWRFGKASGKAVVKP